MFQASFGHLTWVRVDNVALLPSDRINIGVYVLLSILLLQLQLLLIQGVLLLLELLLLKGIHAQALKLGLELSQMLCKPLALLAESVVGRNQFSINCRINLLLQLVELGRSQDLIDCVLQTHAVINLLHLKMVLLLLLLLPLLEVLDLLLLGLLMLVMLVRDARHRGLGAMGVRTARYTLITRWHSGSMSSGRGRKVCSRGRLGGRSQTRKQVGSTRAWSGNGLFLIDGWLDSIKGQGLYFLATATRRKTRGHFQPVGSRKRVLRHLSEDACMHARLECLIPLPKEVGHSGRSFGWKPQRPARLVLL